MIVNNTLGRQFDKEVPDKVWVRHHLYQDRLMLRLSGPRDRPLFPPRRQLVSTKPTDNRPRIAVIAQGGVVQEAEERGTHPLRSRLPVH